MMSQLDDDAKMVLRIVAERDMDGYLLKSKTGLSSDAIEKAVGVLVSNGLIRVKGVMAGPQILESWFQAAPGAMRELR